MERHEKGKIAPGAVIETSEHKYRILYIKNDAVFVCQIDIAKLNIFAMALQKVNRDAIIGKIKVFREEETIVSREDLSDDACAKLDFWKSIMQEVSRAYGPTYMELTGKGRKSSVEEIINKHNLSRVQFWRMVNKWLKAGFSDYAIVDKRGLHSERKLYKYQKKPGRKGARGVPLTEELREKFEEGRKIYLADRRMSVSEAFDALLELYYQTAGDKILTNSPTLRQFQYFVAKNTTSREMKVKRTSAREYRNDNRSLTGDTRYMVYGPGDVFYVDETELDISVVSSIRPDRVIGRPIVYAIKDVYTKGIVAVSVAFDNNSMIGLTNCFLNLIDDKVELCKKYGIDMDPAFWPSGYLPHKITSDRGSEYLSNACEEISRRLGITHDEPPAAMGSMKGDIERFFGEFHKNIYPATKNNGFIEKRHDSRHHQKATLTYEDIWKMLLSYILYYNSHNKDWLLEKQMIAEGISPNPCDFYAYGCKHFGAPVPITNAAQFFFTLMEPCYASISRRGFTLNGLVYNNLNDQYLQGIIENRKPRSKMSFRIDPRDIGSLYYLREGKLCYVPLSDRFFAQASFVGITLDEWQVVLRYIKDEKDKNELPEREKENMLRKINDAIVQEARDRDPGIKNLSDMRTARYNEKMLVQNEQSIFFRLAALMRDARDTLSLEAFEDAIDAASPVLEMEDPNAVGAENIEPVAEESSSSPVPEDTVPDDPYSYNTDFTDDEYIGLFGRRKKS